MGNLKSLLADKATLENEIANLRESVGSIDEQIGELLKPGLEQIRGLQGKEFGAVNLNVDGVKVTHTVPKKVEWDQEGLADLNRRIRAAGDDPELYMRAKYDIPEKQYKAIPEELRPVFDAARVVKAGKPTVKFEDFDN